MAEMTQITSDETVALDACCSGTFGLIEWAGTDTTRSRAIPAGSAGRSHHSIDREGGLDA
jgi:hypothetical protein